MTDPAPSPRVFNVLFLCTHNSARSIIAEAVMNKIGKSRFRAYSAGSNPGGMVNPRALKLLSTLGYDTTGVRSKSWDEFAVPGAPRMDFVFTVCDDAAAEVCPIWPGQPMTAHWGVRDPSRVEGTEAEKGLCVCGGAPAFAPPDRASHQPSHRIHRAARPATQDRRDRPHDRYAGDGFVSARLSQKIVAEALGTGLLVAAVVGSGIMAARLSGGNDALALLCNTLATGAILVVLIIVFSGISGAHFNPAVSAVFWLRNEMTGRQATAFFAAQIIGGILGTLAAHLMFDEAVFQFSIKVRSGPSQWFSEFVAAFGLVLTILGTLRWRPEAVPYTVGLYITSAYWFTASTSFANPAVTIARALSNTFAGIRPIDVTAFIVAQFAGALFAMVLAKWLLASEDGETEAARAARAKAFFKAAE